MAEQVIVNDPALLPEMIGGPPEINGVPKNDRGRHEVEPRCPVTLVLECAIS